MTEALFDELNFCARAAAIDELEFCDRPPDLLRELEEVDARLFERLRAEIRGGARDVRTMIDRYVPVDERRHEPMRYDVLDAFINGLLLSEPLPAEAAPDDPEMIRYQQTPSHFVLEMIDWISDSDHFVDVGSGLGQVAMLVHLLTGIRATGLEIESAFCDYATRSAHALNLRAVEFLNVDAREASYIDGTIFFLYTPFVGRMLATVLDRFRAESAQRTIKLVTYGPITAEVNREPWLKRMGGYDYAGLFCGR